MKVKDLIKVLIDFELNDEIEDYVPKLKDGSPKKEKYVIRIDPKLSFDEMMEEGGYNYINNDINEQNFPLNKEYSDIPYNKTVKLIQFKEAILTKDILFELEKNNLRPANLRELCAFGATFPEFQNVTPIVALGSQLPRPDGNVDVPYLYRYGSERGLGLLWDGPRGRWGAGDRFLALGK